jgi:ribonuclease HI
MRLEGYSDADWAGNVSTRRSTTGYIVMLNGRAIAWRSHLQLTVALSTMEAEYMALTEAIKELKWLRTFLAELGYKNQTNSEATVLHSDNQSVIALAKNPVAHARAKHIDIRHHFIREAVQDNIIWVQYIPTAEMTADSLTKAEPGEA